MCIHREGSSSSVVLPGSLLQKAMLVLLHGEDRVRLWAPSSFVEESTLASAALPHTVNIGQVQQHRREIPNQSTSKTLLGLLLHPEAAILAASGLLSSVLLSSVEVMLVLLVEVPWP